MLTTVTLIILFTRAISTSDIVQLITKDPIIDPTMYDEYPELLTLDMSNQTSFQFPVNKVLLRHTNLSKYSCNNCGVHSIYLQSLSHLPFLTELELNNNSLSYIHPDSFRKNDQLRKVQLMNNQLATFNPEATLRYFTQISLFYLDGNPSFDVNQVHIFLPWLHHFGCDNCNTSFIEKATMRKWPKLVQMFMSHNQLERVDRDAFEEMDRIKLVNFNENPDLTSLMLRSKTLRWVKAERCGLEGTLDTSNLPALEYLSVQANRISKINEHGFERNMELKTIILDDNMIEKIPERLLRLQLPKMEVLCIDKNPLQPWEHLEPFVRTISMKKLRRGCSDDDKPEKQFEFYLPSRNGVAYYTKQRNIHISEEMPTQILSNRNIVYIEDDFFSDLSHVTDVILDNNFFDLSQKMYVFRSSSITTLSMVNCSIASISDYAFRKLPSLQSLDLSNNKLKVLYSTNLFQENQNIRYLNLANNEIAAINHEFIFDLKNLRSLNLNGNQMLSNLEGKPFLFSSTLKELSCSSCGFSQIDDMTMAHLRDLKQLNLSHNHIAYIDKHAFRGLKQLSHLDLHNNHLRSFKPDLSEMPNLNTLCLGRNMHFDFDAPESKFFKDNITKTRTLEKNCTDRGFSEKLIKEIKKSEPSPSAKLRTTNDSKTTTITRDTEVVPAAVVSSSATYMSSDILILLLVLGSVFHTNGIFLENSMADRELTSVPPPDEYATEQAYTILQPSCIIVQ